MTAAEFKPNTEGVFYDLPAEVYHAAPGLSHSMTKHLDPPARLPVYMNEKREPSAEMILGTLVHAKILEPETELPQISVKPEGMKFSTNEGKAWKRDKEGAGKLILTQEQWDALGGCVKSVSEHETCRTLFSKGRSEVSLFARDEATGVLLKARIDFAPVGNCLADIKTVQDEKASEDGFSKVLYDQRYYTQASWYLRLWNQLCPNDYKSHFMFIPVEKTEPYLVGVHFVNPESLELGRKQNEKDIKTYAECANQSYWPGYNPTPKPIGVPKWAIIKNQNAEHAEWLSKVGQSL